LLGADPVVPVAAAAPAPVVDTRLTLLGVVSPRGSRAQREAMALISVDGKPARTYRVGAVVDGNRVLQSVSLRGAEIGQRGGPALVSLSLPAAPAPAARGFPGVPAGAPSQPPGLPPGVAEQPPEGQPGAEGQVPGQDRARMR
jgi:general secretion pathway protein C